MNADGAAFALAALFTAGCVAIHGLRRHAKAMTPSLTLVMISLFLFVVLVALAEKPAPTQARKQVPPIAHRGW